MTSDVSPGPALSVVVVTYSRDDLLEPCLESIVRALDVLGEPSELVVIDNGSQPKVSALLSSRFPGAGLVQSPENVGFAGAAALGPQRTGGEWIALFNDDLTVEPDALRAMLDAGRADDRVGSVAPQMRFYDPPDRINSAGIQVDELGLANDRLVGEPIAASEPDVTDVFGPSGGAALYRRTMLDEIGGFDGSFFTYLEDVDVAWRAQLAGWRSVYTPHAVVHHHHSATFEHHSSWKHYYVGRNRVILLAKNADGSHLRRHGLSMLAYDLAYVSYVALTRRTLHPLHGRVAGLRAWRRYRRSATMRRRPVALAKRAGLREALRRNRAWPGS